MVAPLVALPFRRPLCNLRNFVFLGSNMVR
jgi:hypothetical protein